MRVKAGLRIGNILLICKRSIFHLWDKDLHFKVSCELSFEDSEHFHGIGSGLCATNTLITPSIGSAELSIAREKRTQIFYAATLKIVSKLGGLYSEGKDDLRAQRYGTFESGCLRLIPSYAGEALR